MSGEKSTSPGEKKILLAADIQKAINYASYQNSVPLMRSFSIRSQTEQTLSNLRLKLTVDPPFARSKVWAIDRVTPQDELTLSDRNVELDPAYLSGLNESEKARLRFQLIEGETVIASLEEEVRILASDEWGGFHSMASLLAAFVMPNDPAVATIIRQASKILGDHGYQTALDGYQSGDPKRIYMLGAAIWSAIAGLRLTYAEPPKSFEREGQKVRVPSGVTSQGLATCLDSSLLFASAFEATGLNPVICFQKDHSFTGFWLVKRNFTNLIETDPIEIRKAIAAREFLVFETTKVTFNPPATFEDAIATARIATAESEEHKFVGAVDIARARSSQIRPLASHQPSSGYANRDEEADATGLPLPPMPDFGSMPADIGEEKPETAAGRIERWQRKLLDLSLRNRLLNFKTSKQTLQITCPDVSSLEDMLANEDRLKVISLAEQNPLAGRDKALHLQQTGKDLDVEFARDALARNELCSPLSAADMNARMTGLYRRAKSDIAEGGTNTLFLAIGFLKWKKTPEDPKSYLAPLVLVPVVLVRRSASSQFRIRHHEDDVRFNSTLAEMLKQDFSLDLSFFERELPRDDSGIDVSLVMEMMRHTVRDVAGFEVSGDEVALSTFSFAKYLMWKDLTDRLDQLRENRLVKHLVDNPDQVFEPGLQAGIPDEQGLDQKFQPADFVCPLPADSSQLAAVAAAAQGNDFVLVGPPGTGKSQTISNMISQCLATGRTVLFVAEKTAALNVVHRRLHENGLGDLTVELHSNKADRRTFVRQLKEAWLAPHLASEKEWIDVNDQLKLRRDQLTAYVEAIHRKRENGWTVFEATGICAAGEGKFAPEIDWPQNSKHDEESLRVIVAALEEIALVAPYLSPTPALATINSTNWSISWERDLFSNCTIVATAADKLRQETTAFYSLLNLRRQGDYSSADLDLLQKAADAILATANGNKLPYFKQDFDSLDGAVTSLEKEIGEIRQLQTALDGKYTLEAISRIPVEEIEQEWRRASDAIWPATALSKRKIAKRLQEFAHVGKASVENDLRVLKGIKQHLASITSNPATKLQGYDSIFEINAQQLRVNITDSRAAKDAFLLLSNRAADSKSFSETIGQHVLNPAGNPTLMSASENYLHAFAGFIDALEGFKKIAGALPVNESSETLLADASKLAAELTEVRPAIKTWTEWCGLKQRAIALKLEGFINAIEKREIESREIIPSFKLSYSRWWLPIVIDDDATLRSFQRYRHEDVLQKFRELDTAALKMAPQEVHRRVHHNFPNPDRVARNSELGLLRHQMDLQRPSQSIRALVSQMPESFAKLAPCLMMSPLSIAQYLPANQALYDVVIFDEASQITTWDAVGAIARGRQTIIVGDPKQLPPTNFFGRADGGDEEDDIAYYEKDLDSVLDEAKASGVPVQNLRWHYRSRHESLIQFSNFRYYDNQLITFPSPFTKDTAVSYRLINGSYDRGKSRTNREEAISVVKECVRRMEQGLELEEEQRSSIGVVTFNIQQQSLIQDLLDAERRKNPELEWFFSEDRFEPLIVKNIENVQGDERDIILFSIAFAKDAAGKITMNFGALNRDGGEKRLNVAVSRARQEMLVFASLTTDQIDLSRTKWRGVADLKLFLEYAERGLESFVREVSEAGEGYDSPFEEAVANSLRLKGWEVRSQIGVSGFRIDLGIVHPEKPGSFLAGVECDGATYHRSPTAKDRDRIREQVLNNLGWSILRIWSTDWWHNSTGVLEHIHQKLEHLLAKDQATDLEAEERERVRQERQKQKSELLSPSITSSHDTPIALDTVKDYPSYAQREQAEDDRVHLSQAALVASLPAAPSSIGQSSRSNNYFKRAELSSFKCEPDLFFEFSYGSTIENMVQAVLEAEAPVRTNILAQRIARAHGWQRTGARIREVIKRHLKTVTKTTESSGEFLWNEASVPDVIGYRYHTTDDDRRPVSDISLAEIRGLIQSKPGILEADDPALAIAREMGTERLTGTARNRLDEAIMSKPESQTNPE